MGLARLLLATCLLAAALQYADCVCLEPFSFDQTATAPVPAADDNYGASVAVDGSTPIVGGGTFVVNGGGDSIYVFTNSGFGWSAPETLTPANATANAFEGGSVAISVDTIVAGAPNAGLTGSTYFFARSGSTWSEIGKFSEANIVGEAVSVAGAIAAVGSPSCGMNNRGCVYIYHQQSLTEWIVGGSLTAADATDAALFGHDVALDGDTLVVSTQQQAIYVFVYANAAWSQQAKLAVTAGVGPLSVGLHANTAVVGASFSGLGGTVAVFSRDGATWSNDPTFLVAEAAAAADFFGADVDVYGDTIIVGAPMRDGPAGLDQGAFFMFCRNSTGWWSQSSENYVSGNETDFGSSVAIDRSTLAVGAPSWSDLFDNQGAAFVYHSDEIDGCDQPTNPCTADGDSAGVCVDVPMSGTDNTCECSPGYEAVSGGCIGVLCDTLVGDNSDVDTTSPRYPSTATYTCDTGYSTTDPLTRTCTVTGSWTGAAPVCSDTDGCGVMEVCAGDPLSQCVDVPAPGAGYTCDCSTGFEEEDGGCVDTDGCVGHECDTGEDTTAGCTDQPAPGVGGICQCNSGFVEDDGVCVDEPGCADADATCRSASDTTAVCSDTEPPGLGHTCTCAAAFEDVGGICMNIDECEGDPCAADGDEDSTCSDNFGTPGYSCTCTSGYIAMAGTCSNIDSCLGNPCAPGTCNDIAPPGTGRTCNCPSGYVHELGACADFNACTIDTCDVYDAAATCTDNVAPSLGWSCICSSGFVINETSVTCVDADGCSPNFCDPVSEVCVDVPAPGAASAHVCNCATGYQASAGACVDIPGCVGNTCRADGDTTAACVDRAAPNVGYTCTCSLGYVAANGNTECHDLDGCDLNLCNSFGDTGANCTDAAPPSAGYTCVCSSGWVDVHGVCTESNQVALIVSVSISTTAPVLVVGSPVTCTPTYNAPWDAGEFTWWVNGLPTAYQNGGYFILPGDFNISCKASAYPGGPITSSPTRTVVDTAPALSRLQANGSQPYAFLGSTIVCDYAIVDADGDPEGPTSISWLDSANRAGEAFFNGAGAEYKKIVVTRDSIPAFVTCRVTPITDHAGITKAGGTFTASNNVSVVLVDDGYSSDAFLDFGLTLSGVFNFSEDELSEFEADWTGELNDALFLDPLDERFLVISVLPGEFYPDTTVVTTRIQPGRPSAEALFAELKLMWTDRSSSLYNGNFTGLIDNTSGNETEPVASVVPGGNDDDWFFTLDLKTWIFIGAVVILLICCITIGLVTRKKKSASGDDDEEWGTPKKAAPTPTTAAKKPKTAIEDFDELEIEEIKVATPRTFNKKAEEAKKKADEDKKKAEKKAAEKKKAAAAGKKKKKKAGDDSDDEPSSPEPSDDEDDAKGTPKKKAAEKKKAAPAATPSGGKKKKKYSDSEEENLD